MFAKHSVATAVVIGGACCMVFPAAAQNAPAHPDTVPIYKVTVISRTVSAVNYQYRNGPTEIGFRGTVLLPEAKGGAIVESKAGRTEIDAHFEHLAAAQKFGAEYLTYVLWAITPEGNVKNLGEVLANGSDKAHTHVTTDLQAFGLVVTAEPYSSVRGPGDVVVMENQIRPETIGGTEPIQARYEFMPRGTYTYNVGASLPPTGPKVSMAEYEQTLELYQALNAVQIAEAQGAAKYAPEVMSKARQQYEKARQLQIEKASRSDIVTEARRAAQTAEDARMLAATRKHDAELASARSDVDREQQLRAQAEAKARAAQAEAADAQVQAIAAANALEAERRSHRETSAEAHAAQLEARAEAPVAVVEPPASHPNNHVDSARQTLRSHLLAQLNGPLEALDSGRGIVVTIPDSDFRGTALNPTTANDLATVSRAVGSQPGLMVEVDGNSDAAGPSGEVFSNERATAVKDALFAAGLRAEQITARGLGNSHPFGPNSGQGKLDNRRVEIVIHGAPIGDAPTWDKPYSLQPEP
jgi:outer membrane protein OmpA-like peptidoglycan-associated protein